MSIAWDPGGGERFFGRSWGRMVTVLARILRIWGSKPEGQEIRRPLPTAGGARQRRDYKQQVLCSASEGQARGGQKGKPGAE